MCASCGCGSLEDTRGDDRNLAWSKIRAAAEAAGITPAEVIDNLIEAAKDQIYGSTRGPK